MLRPELVLASTSRYRQALMNRLGLPYTAVPPLYEEENDLPLPPTELVPYLSRRKAESLQATYGHALIIGSDQALSIDGGILGKPGTVEAAEAQLARMSGRRLELLTGLCVIGLDGELYETLDTVTLHVRPLSPEMIRHYVRIDQPLDCAGSFKIESLGVALFDRIETTDPTAIEGLPLITLTRILAGLGCDPLTR